MLPHRFARRVLAHAFFLVVATSAVHAQWTVVPLHPPGSTASVTYGMRNNQQVGSVDGVAGYWNSTAASFVPLTPNTAISNDGVQQVGQIGAHACVWTGTGGSLVDLHPAVPGIVLSIATGVFAGIQVGYWIDGSFTLSHAGYWTDSAASWVDLNPPGAFGSTAEGIYNGTVIGGASFPSGLHAIIWFGAPNSFADLNPAGASSSYGTGIYLNKQVGRTIMIGESFPRASLWTSTAASWVDLHPPAAYDSQARAVYNSVQCGYGSMSGVNHAFFWESTAASWVDLHSFLAPTYSESAAFGVWTNGVGTHYVCGNAFDTVSGQYRAILWVRNAPTTTDFCLGDGSGTPCPCLNNAPLNSGTGCLHSLGSGGKVVATGNASIANDTLVLLGTQMTNSSALYFQGTAQVNAGAGSVFGDGLRCAGGSVLRLGIKTNALGASSYPSGGSPLISVQGQVTLPGTRYYQIWYRNADATYCTVSTFNLSNGLTVTWTL